MQARLWVCPLDDVEFKRGVQVACVSGYMAHTGIIEVFDVVRGDSCRTVHAKLACVTLTGDTLDIYFTEVGVWRHGKGY